MCVRNPSDTWKNDREEFNMHVLFYLDFRGHQWSYWSRPTRLGQRDHDLVERLDLGGTLRDQQIRKTTGDQKKYPASEIPKKKDPMCIKT